MPRRVVFNILKRVISSRSDSSSNFYCNIIPHTRGVGGGARVGDGLTDDFDGPGIIEGACSSPGRGGSKTPATTDRPSEINAVCSGLPPPTVVLCCDASLVVPFNILVAQPRAFSSAGKNMSSLARSESTCVCVWVYVVGVPWGAVAHRSMANGDERGMQLVLYIPGQVAVRKSVLVAAYALRTNL